VPALTATMYVVLTGLMSLKACAVNDLVCLPLVFLPPVCVCVPTHPRYGRVSREMFERLLWLNAAYRLPEPLVRLCLELRSGRMNSRA
jgi:hypothetical protein